MLPASDPRPDISACAEFLASARQADAAGDHYGHLSIDEIEAATHDHPVRNAPGCKNPCVVTATGQPEMQPNWTAKRHEAAAGALPIFRRQR